MLNDKAVILNILEILYTNIWVNFILSCFQIELVKLLKSVFEVLFSYFDILIFDHNIFGFVFSFKQQNKLDTLSLVFFKEEMFENFEPIIG